MIPVASLGRRGLHFSVLGRKQLISWPWLLVLLVLIVLVAQQLLDELGLGWMLGVISSLLVVVLLLWQQYQIRQFETRLDRLERLMAQRRQVVSAKTIAKVDKAEKLLDDFFGEERTRH